MRTNGRTGVRTADASAVPLPLTSNTAAHPSTSLPGTSLNFLLPYGRDYLEVVTSTSVVRTARRRACSCYLTHQLFRLGYYELPASRNSIAAKLSIAEKKPSAPEATAVDETPTPTPALVLPSAPPPTAAAVVAAEISYNALSQVCYYI